MGSGTGAHDPSAPDYGGTSPASLGRKMKVRPYTNALPVQRGREGVYSAALRSRL